MSQHTCCRGHVPACEIQKLAAVAQQVQQHLESRVFGHEDDKLGLILGLLSSEHIYIEGPPGSAKTMLAETAATASGLDIFFYQLHRDTRLQELVGPEVLIRTRDEQTGGE